MGHIFCEKRLDYENRATSVRRAANDNLPHNVIELARPAQADYAASEKDPRGGVRLERDLLKREQRQEREAWFEEGKTCSSTRNAIWREVKEEYREDWKQHFADKADARRKPKAFASAVTRTSNRQVGDWDQARAAFDDRDILARPSQPNSPPRRRTSGGPAG